MAKKLKSLFICNHCNTDTRNCATNIEKVRLGGLANMLCVSCKMELEDSIRDVAKRYLR